MSNVGLFALLTIIDLDIFYLATALATHFNTLHYYYYKINMNEYFLKIPKKKLIQAFKNQPITGLGS